MESPCVTMKIHFQGTTKRVTAEDVASLTFEFVHEKAKLLVASRLPSTQQPPAFGEPAPCPAIRLTYEDTDGDDVALEDDRDLVDALQIQQLNPLHVTVHLNPTHEATSKPVHPGIDNLESSSSDIQRLAQLIGSLSRTFHDPSSSIPDALLATVAEAATLLKQQEDGKGKPGPSRSCCKRGGNQDSGPPKEGEQDHVVHFGVQCDGCGMCPIVGCRFRSLVQHDYDLCATCYKVKTTNGEEPESHYERIDTPPPLKRRCWAPESGDPFSDGAGHLPPPLPPFAAFPGAQHPPLSCGRPPFIPPWAHPYSPHPFGRPFCGPRGGCPATCTRPVSCRKPSPEEVKLERASSSGNTKTKGDAKATEEDLAAAATAAVTVPTTASDSAPSTAAASAPSAPPAPEVNVDLFMEDGEEVEELEMEREEDAKGDRSKEEKEGVQVDEKKDKLEELARKLQLMGFADEALNRVALETNKGNVAGAITDLVASENWDALLVDLQEMGFDDVERNKALMMKHKGSLKRVVRDLVGGGVDEV